MPKIIVVTRQKKQKQFPTPASLRHLNTSILRKMFLYVIVVSEILFCHQIHVCQMLCVALFNNKTISGRKELPPLAALK